MPKVTWARALRPIRIVLALAATLATLWGCKDELPAPAYPSPEDPPLEETELWHYFEEPEAEEEDDSAWQEEEDEGWDEGADEAEPDDDQPPAR